MYAFSSSRGASGTGRQFVAVDTPLGKSVPSTRHIRTTSQYVTEYEASFKWPPRSAYKIPRLQPVSETKVEERCWRSLLNTVRELVAVGHEKALMEALTESLADHKLNLVLEYANSRLVDQMLAAVMHKEENGVYPSEVSEEVLELLRRFTSIVAAIKER